VVATSNAHKAKKRDYFAAIQLSAETVAEIFRQLSSSLLCLVQMQRLAAFIADERCGTSVIFPFIF
jgi:hypothetical protein